MIDRSASIPSFSSSWLDLAAPVLAVCHIFAGLDLCCDPSVLKAGFVHDIVKALNLPYPIATIGYYLHCRRAIKYMLINPPPISDNHPQDFRN